MEERCGYGLPNPCGDNGEEWTRPGFRAVAMYRFGLWRMSMRLPLSVIYSRLHRWIRNRYGIELHYTATVSRAGPQRPSGSDRHPRIRACCSPTSTETPGSRGSRVVCARSYLDADAAVVAISEYYDEDDVPEDILPDVDSPESIDYPGFC